MRPVDDRRVMLAELTEHGRPYAQSLFHPLLDLLEPSTPAATPSQLAQPLASISGLIEFFDHFAAAAPDL
jgi:hypothetical protein